MLQRAASNAYNYWWASSIRSKQSKWLDTDLEEMDEKVTAMMKLIEQDADSFGKKAELYFRRRPELIHYVEEMHKSYKALADKYDRISGELHKANHTLATVCPEQVQFAMQEFDDDENPLKAAFMDDHSRFRGPPDFPQQNTKNMIREEHRLQKKLHHRRISSQISKDKAQEEIERLQKEILGLQTEKEFIKSSYQRTLNRYLQIEKEITEMQEEVCSLQDLYNASAIIQDDEARSLMAATAIKSCEDSLTSIQEQQKVSNEEARIGSQRIKDAVRKLSTLKGECDESEIPSTENSDENTEIDSTTVKAEEVNFLKGETELQTMCEKIREHFEMSSEASIVELAEKIDELVDKVVDLEVTVSTQTAQIKRLNSETDELHENLRTLEEEKMALVDNSNSLTEKLKQAEEELQRIQELEKCIHDDKGILRKQFIEACRNLNSLSEKLLSPYQEEETFEECSDERPGSPKSKKDILEGELQLQMKELIDIPDFQQLLLYFGLEGKAKVFITKYRTIVLNYRDTKNRLMEIERKNKEYHLETMIQVKELKTANSIKDDEIGLLKEILTSLQANLHVNAPRNMDKPSGEDGNESDSDGVSEPRTSTIEDKFRADIDRLLEQNMDFWLRFSTSYHQIQIFQKTFKDLKAETEKSNETKSVEGNANANTATAAASVVEQQQLPLDKRLRELNTELQVWLEKNALLNGELKSRYSSLSSIKDEISRVSMGDESQEVNFSPYQAAKFQGEVLNMQLENNRVAKELQAGEDFVKGLQVELSWTLAKLNKKYELSTRSNQNQDLGHMPSKARIPLRTFLFGVKPKKPSLFACINPAMEKEYHRLRSEDTR